MDGAKAVLFQIQAKPLEEHGTLTRVFVGKFLPDIEALANGQPCSEALERDVRIVNQAPLDETAGEGYHRSTKHEHQRAPASSSQHLLRNTRLPQNLALVKHFVKLGPCGKAVVQSEWKIWKRVLQDTAKEASQGRAVACFLCARSDLSPR